MMTYQMVMKVTGAPRDLVIQVKRDKIGHRNHCTSEELHEIVHEIQRRQQHGTNDIATCETDKANQPRHDMGASHETSKP